MGQAGGRAEKKRHGGELGQVPVWPRGTQEGSTHPPPPIPAVGGRQWRGRGQRKDCCAGFLLAPISPFPAIGQLKKGIPINLVFLVLILLCC